MPDYAAWRAAYATQSASDLQVYQWLTRRSFPACHRLHYLQMHLEKLAKAYLLHPLSPLWPLDEVRTTHNVIAKVIPQVVREYWRRAGETRAPAISRLGRLRDLCREIDLLHPAVDDDGRRPDNCEYPWPAFDQNKPVVRAPCGERFPVDERLRSGDGRMLLKLASLACQELSAPRDRG